MVSILRRVAVRVLGGSVRPAVRYVLSRQEAVSADLAALRARVARVEERMGCSVLSESELGAVSASGYGTSPSEPRPRLNLIDLPACPHGEAREGCDCKVVIELVDGR